LQGRPFDNVGDIQQKKLGNSTLDFSISWRNWKYKHFIYTVQNPLTDLNQCFYKHTIIDYVVDIYAQSDIMMM